MIDIWRSSAGTGTTGSGWSGPTARSSGPGQDDGVHLRREASEWVADLVVDVVANRWNLPLG